MDQSLLRHLTMQPKFIEWSFVSRQNEVYVFFWRRGRAILGNILPSLRRYLSTFIVARWKPWISDQFDLGIYGKKYICSIQTAMVENIFVFLFGWSEASKNLASASIWGFRWKFDEIIFFCWTRVNALLLPQDTYLHHHIPSLRPHPLRPPPPFAKAAGG